MKSLKAFCLLTLGLVVLAACNKATYRKTPGGMPYQVFASKDTLKVETGNVIKVNFIQKVNDSVYFNNTGLPALYIPVNVQNPYDLSEVWTSLKQGDSIVATQMMDTFIKRNPQRMDPKFKNGDRILTYVKILKVYKNKEEAAAAEKEDLTKWKETEVEKLGEYLKEKGIQAEKTTSGSYVQTITPGTGIAIDSGKFVSVNYTGTSFSGTRFDSNTDTSFHHAEPYSFTVGAGEMIKGFDEAVTLMKKGGMAKVYIPSMLAYGAYPQSPKIKPYENLEFDIEIVDVADKRPAPPTAAAPK